LAGEEKGPDGLFREDRVRFGGWQGRIIKSGFGRFREAIFFFPVFGNEGFYKFPVFRGMVEVDQMAQLMYYKVVQDRFRRQDYVPCEIDPATG